MSWPKTDDPRTEFVTLRLTATESADVDWLQSHVNAKSRSSAVRDALDRVIAAERKRAARTRPVHGSEKD